MYFHIFLVFQITFLPSHGGRSILNIYTTLSVCSEIVDPFITSKLSFISQSFSLFLLTLIYANLRANYWIWCYTQT